MTNSSEKTVIASLSDRLNPGSALPVPANNAVAARARPLEVGTSISLELDLLDDNPFQPRLAMDETAISELVASIRIHGLLQPITVRRVGQRYQVVAGHRRLTAFRRLREEEPQRFARIPAQWRNEVSDEEMAIFGLIENLQRADLSPLEAAQGLAAFQESEKLSTAQLAARTGLDGERVKRLLRLHRAPPVVKEACHTGVLVPVRDERGELVAAASGEPKQQRRRLDLLASLEFTKLHAFFAERKPQSADERTRTAMQRAVADGWGLRRIQEHVQAIIKGKPEESTATPVSKPPFAQDAGSLRIWPERLKTANSDQQNALRVLLQGLLSELSGGCEQR